VHEIIFDDRRVQVHKVGRNRRDPPDRFPSIAQLLASRLAKAVVLDGGRALPLRTQGCRAQ